MTEAVRVSFYTSNIETFIIDPDETDISRVSHESEKTTYVARTAIDKTGELVELYTELCNEGLMKRDNVVIVKEKMHLKNAGEIKAQECVRIESKEIESTGSIEAGSVELTAGKVKLIGELALIRADEILIRAGEVIVDGALVEGHLRLEGCNRLEVSNLSDEVMSAWREAAPEGCTFVTPDAITLDESTLDESKEEVLTEVPADTTVEAPATELLESEEEPAVTELVESEESVETEELASTDELTESPKTCELEENLEEVEAFVAEEQQETPVSDNIFVA